MQQFSHSGTRFERSPAGRGHVLGNGQTPLPYPFSIGSSISSSISLNPLEGL